MRAGSPRSITVAPAVGNPIWLIRIVAILVVILCSQGMVLLRKTARIVALAALLTAAGAASPVLAQVPMPEVPAANPAVEQQNFADFLQTFRTTALSAGITAETWDRATSGISFNPRVEALNDKQPEFVRPIWDYLAGVITPERVGRGRELMAENAPLFRRLHEQYGVPPAILTAIWAIETGYGRIQGNFNLVEALANLSFEGPRAAYGQRELIAALQIAQQQHIDPRQMMGSWAGAFGQTQFIPSTFLKYAVDGNGDGRIDLWNSPADALASTANYLQQSGWEADQPWGEEVQLPDGFSYAEADPSIGKSVAEWEQMGVRPVPGEQLPAPDVMASINLPAGYRGPAFLVLNNFNVLLKYNSAIPYALAVGLLADRLRGFPGVRASWPAAEAALDQPAAMALQQGLTDLGFPAGGADGVLGRRSAQAIRSYQQSRGLPADGFPTVELLERIRREHGPMPQTGSTALPSQ